MTKRVRRADRRRRPRPGRTRARRAIQRRASRALAESDARPVRLLDRILAAPHAARVVARLQPEVLHSVIQHCGLEDCGALLKLATPEQLTRVFDLDLWRADQPGDDERFDADRFGVWLEVMVEAGTAAAATTIAAMDTGVVVAGLASQIRVFDYAAVADFVSLDGELTATGHTFDPRLRCEVGGYVVEARRTESWDAIVAVLHALDAAHREYFDRVMSGCRRLSSSRPEVDGLDDLLTADDQVMFDVAVDREERRDTQGYVTPAEARAFLQTLRRSDSRWGRLEAVHPAASGPQAPDIADVPADAVAAVVDLLLDEGVLPARPRALLTGSLGDAAQVDGPRLARIHAHMQFAHDRNPVAYSKRTEELAYLANAIVAGSSVQSRAFTPHEASRAAAAVCNLAMENWSAAPGIELPEGFLVDRDLVSVFQVGWTILHENVSMYAAERVIASLTSLRCDDPSIQDSLETLRLVMTRHWRAGEPWRAREALDVIAMLDAPTWAALLGLIDEFPVLHAAVGALLEGNARQVSASAFEFISENSQISSVRAFMESLPDRLRS